MSGCYSLLSACMLAFLAAQPEAPGDDAPPAAADSSAASDVQDENLQKLVERERKKLLKQVQNKIRKGKGDFFAVALVEHTYHTEASRWTVTEKVVDGELVQYKITELSTGEEYLPVPAAEYVVVEGLDAAVKTIVDHMLKYVRAPAPKRRHSDAPVEQPPPTGDWASFGRFAKSADADEALRQAQAAFDAGPHWRLDEEDAEGEGAADLDDKRAKE